MIHSSSPSLRGREHLIRDRTCGGEIELKLKLRSEALKIPRNDGAEDRESDRRVTGDGNAADLDASGFLQPAITRILPTRRHAAQLGRRCPSWRR